MKYITIADLNETIRKNFYKIPHDVDFVIGVPRSGMLPATIISELLNRPLIDSVSFANGIKPYGGARLSYNDFSGSKTNVTKNKVLVVDDTIASGKSIKECKKLLEPFKNDYEFIYFTVYFEGPSSVDNVDMYLEDTRINGVDKDLVIFEWNVFHQILALTKSSMWDMDGVLCKNPPNDFYKEAYEAYIKDAIPLFVPSLEIGEIVTYRVNGYREITSKWLKEHGIKCRKLVMFNADTREERERSGMPSHIMKGIYYRDSNWAKLFVESDDGQAFAISQIAGKPVYCVESNKMYGVNQITDIGFNGMKVLLCCIGRKCNRYMREYVEYYKNLGFTNIVLYDNNFDGEENFEDVIGDYIKDGFVIVENFRNIKRAQFSAYYHCWRHYRDKYDWIAFFDTDEFLTFTEPTDICDFLADKKFDNFDAVVFNWECYGDNGLVRYDDRGVIERFQNPIPYDTETFYPTPVNNHIKSIVRCDYGKFIYFPTPHNTSVPMQCTADGVKRKMTGSFEKYDFSVARIRHYSTKTIEEYCDKMLIGTPDRFWNKDDTESYMRTNFFKVNEPTEEKINIIKDKLGIDLSDLIKK